MSDSSRSHGLQPTRLLCPWDFPGKSTGVGCHCLLRSSHPGRHQTSLSILASIPSSSFSSPVLASVTLLSSQPQLLCTLPTSNLFPSSHLCGQPSCPGPPGLLTLAATPQAAPFPICPPPPPLSHWPAFRSCPVSSGSLLPLASWPPPSALPLALYRPAVRGSFYVSFLSFGRCQQTARGTL